MVGGGFSFGDDIGRESSVQDKTMGRGLHLIQQEAKGYVDGTLFQASSNSKHKES